MMYKEFVSLTGLEVSMEEYTSKIEPKYMDSKLDKQEFCKRYVNKLNSMKNKVKIENHPSGFIERNIWIDNLPEERKELRKIINKAFKEMCLSDSLTIICSQKRGEGNQTMLERLLEGDYGYNESWQGYGGWGVDKQEYRLYLYMLISKEEYERVYAKH